MSLYKSHSITKLNFASEVGYRKVIGRKSIVMGLFISQKTFNRDISNEYTWPSLRTAVSGVLSSLESVSAPQTVFLSQDRNGKPMFSLFVKSFWLKHVLLSQQKSDERSLFKPPFWFAVILNSFKTNIFARLK